MPLLESSDVVYFAKTDFRSANRLFGIKRRDRRQHTYIIGKTGVGKTALLHNLAVQDIANGEGLCVIDPHGEFVESLLNKIPKERAKDVIYLNPADTDHPLGFNILEIEDLKYKHLVASGLMSIFTKIWANVWSARMEYIMNNAILALLETPGSTLLGITRILVDKDYRQKIISNVTDPVVKAFWINEFESWRDQFRNEAIAPIQNKVGQFLSTNLIRNVVGQRKSTIDIFDLMNNRKIFLVNVSKGRIGEDNSSLIGAMLITKIQLAAMERVRIPEDERKDFFLYVDEFQNFATDSFAGILSEARKYRLNLILAHQYVGQLVTDVSTKVRDAVFGNVGTMMTFRVGGADAEFLEKEYSPEFTQEDIVNLSNYCIYLRLMVDGVTSRPFSANTLPPFNSPTECATEEEIIQMSRELYTRPVKQVEDDITKWSGTMGEIHGEDSGKHPTNSKFSANCSSCGNTTEVNFKPTEGRPIYCKDCLAKVKSGEIEPVKVRKIKAPKLEDQSKEALADLGIEFTTEESRKTLAPKPSPPRIKEVIHEPSTTEPISLKNLKPIERKPRERTTERQQVDISALRATISQALTEELKPDEKAQEDQKQETENPV